MPAPRRHRRFAAALSLVLALAAFPLGTLASHDFLDVPDSNIFHNDISALAAAGVTTGCGGGNFCPSAFVTREQMAAFMNRLGNLDGEVGHFVCLGRDMPPMGSDGTYSWAGNARLVESGTPLYFTCPVHVPDGATVTALQAKVSDDTGTGSITCIMQRHPTDSASYAEMANIGPSSDGGLAVLVTTAIGEPVIDNAAYGYEVYCGFDGTAAGALLKLFAISVEYTVSGLPVI